MRNTSLPSASMHMPQLDGLRAIAVSAVALNHLWPDRRVSDFLPWGVIGVQLFFVLSGFLITRILLEARAATDSKRASIALAMRRFYIRRFLRIFPLFYATLTILWLLDIPPVRETLWWHLSYLSNVYFALVGSGHGHITHFWSLAVEEQFYLVWPALLLCVPKQRLFTVLCAVIIAAPLYRLTTSIAELHWLVRIFLPFANLDSLGIGSMLAFTWMHPNESPISRRHLKIFGLYIAGPLLILFLALLATRTDPKGLEIVFFRCVLSLFFCWLIDAAALGFSGIFGAILRSPLLTWVGRVSYGVYVIHHFTPEMLSWTCDRVGVSAPNNPLATFLLLYGLSIGIASLSWVLFESPINNLKRHFPSPRCEPQNR